MRCLQRGDAAFFMFDLGILAALLIMPRSATDSVTI
jgi:hypothetical protein